MPTRDRITGPSAAVFGPTLAAWVAGVCFLALAFAVAGLFDYRQIRARSPKPSAVLRLPTVVVQPRLADFGSATASDEVRYLANWIAATRDAGDNGFLVIDKKNAELYVFDAEARLRGSSPVLLGAAPGDESAPGIGSRPLDKVLPQEKTTPAGRFIAERGHDARGEDVVWVDYDASVSVHRVLTTIPEEHRLERLAMPSPAAHWISFGCINVPATFYEEVVRPMFTEYRRMVYVLPDSNSVDKIFGSYNVRAHRAS